MRMTKVDLSNTKTGELLIDLKLLQIMCSCGRCTAKKIGIEAGAVVKIDGRKLYSTEKIRKWIDKNAGRDDNGLSTSPIEVLNLNNRAFLGLKRAKINYVNELCEKSPEWLMRNVRSLGKNSITNIEECLEKVGLSLAN